MAGPLRLNLGCGFVKRLGWVNVDAFAVCDPDVLQDLNQTPWPWADNSVDEIYANHVFEHLEDWWNAFRECGRILRPGGMLDLRVPDESSSTALGYRDHRHVFTEKSFHGCMGKKHGTNAWAAETADSVPLEMIGKGLVPHKRYNWMVRRPFRRLLAFCANHLRNFIHEQRYLFRKVVKDV